MQQLQALSLQRRAELANACDIAARSIKAGNEAQLDRSMPPEKTIGSVEVAALAARAAGGALATITATGRRTNSAASAGSWS